MVDHGPGLWYLLEHEGDLFLEGRYSHSAADYSFPMRLTDDEARAVRLGGTQAAQALYERVQHTAHGVRGSTSPFIGRREGREVDDAIGAAIQTWRNGR